MLSFCDAIYTISLMDPAAKRGSAAKPVLATAACPVQSSSFGSHDRQSSAGDIVLICFNGR